MPDIKVSNGSASAVFQRTELLDILSASVAITCAHPGCNTPAAAIIGGVLVIQHRHHGERHMTVINLMALASELAFNK